jgi:hypothetical protein
VEFDFIYKCQLRTIHQRRPLPREPPNLSNWSRNKLAYPQQLSTVSEKTASLPIEIPPDPSSQPGPHMHLHVCVCGQRLTPPLHQQLHLRPRSPQRLPQRRRSGQLELPRHRLDHSVRPPQGLHLHLAADPPRERQRRPAPRPDRPKCAPHQRGRRLRNLLDARGRRGGVRRAL